MFNEYITNHHKKINLYLVKYDSKLVFDKEIYPHIKSGLQNNLIIFYLKRCLLFWIEYFTERGHRFSHIYEMCITTVRNKLPMSCEFHITQPRQMVELKLKMIIDENPHLLNTLDRTVNHPLFRKNSQILFIN